MAYLRPLAQSSLADNHKPLYRTIKTLLQGSLNWNEDVNALDGEYDVIYVNGSNNVPNLRKDADTWKVRLIEEDFSARMWEGL